VQKRFGAKIGNVVVGHPVDGEGGGGGSITLTNSNDTQNERTNKN
jgi:hypothetical protein